MGTKPLKQMPPLDEDSRLAMPLQEYCQRIGCGRNAGYKAAANGEIPTFQIGRLKFVPAWVWKRLITGKAA